MPSWSGPKTKGSAWRCRTRTYTTLCSARCLVRKTTNHNTVQLLTHIGHVVDIQQGQKRKLLLCNAFFGCLMFKVSSCHL